MQTDRLGLMVPQTASRSSTFDETLFKIGIPSVPRPPRTSPSVAHLHLSRGRQVGSGHHSGVWQAHLDLPYATAHELFHMCCKRPSEPEPVDASPTDDRIASPPGDRADGIPTRFSVAAKIANAGRHELRHLVNEAKMYDRFPQYQSCDWSGYQQVPPVHMPQACCAVAPKSYGFWVPEVTYSRLSNGVEVKPHEVSRPILLMEECGGHVTLEVLTLDQRYGCSMT